MAHSKSAKPPSKPHPNFPLSPRKDGRWSKKVQGKVHTFAGTADEALAEWNRCKDHIFQFGRKPLPGSEEGLTVEDLCDHYLNAKRPLIASGELAQRSYDDYFATCQRLIDSLSKTRRVDALRPDDFDKLRAGIAKTWGPVALGNEVQRIRSVFKFGFEAGHIEKPVRFGPLFKKPSKKVLRQTRAAKGERMLEPAELKLLIEKSGVPLKAMILLALNGGLGNSDLGQMPLAAIDLERGWVRYPRPKTGVDRRFPLWTETVEAIKEAVTKRPEPKQAKDKHLAFVTKYGMAWAKDAPDSPVTKEFRKLLNETNLHRPGIGFYALRHVFETIAGGSRDQVAVDHIMGHAREDMATLYRERIDDDRLRAVTDHVHKWLYPPEKKTIKRPAKGGAK